MWIVWTQLPARKKHKKRKKKSKIHDRDSEKLAVVMRTEMVFVIFHKRKLNHIFIMRLFLYSGLDSFRIICETVHFFVNTKSTADIIFLCVLYCHIIQGVL
ncbi:hypothetical protein XENORESO_010924 [Xenotaenia resolanae]|uniref:Uncharacterized protein n=1 Tax=Xenotaenia resolanae TaxID=208358 RepID=A0ABV0W4Z4_9TELE